MNFTRRDMVTLAGAGLVLNWPIAENDTDQQRLAAAARRLLGGRGSAAAMGDLVAAGSRPGSLVAEVMDAARGDGVDLSGNGDAALDAWLRDRIARDFAEANVVMLDGWMLSAVEARLRGIAYLSRI